MVFYTVQLPKNHNLERKWGDILRLRQAKLNSAVSLRANHQLHLNFVLNFKIPRLAWVQLLVTAFVMFLRDAD